MLIIRLEAKDGTTRDCPLTEMPATFGRLGRSTVKIEDSSVSREHARLFASEGKLFIADLNSSNGTFVNGTRVSRAEVKPGDTIRIGRVEMTLSETAEPTSTGATAIPEPEEFTLDEPPAPERRVSSAPAAPAPAASAAPAPAAPAAPAPAAPAAPAPAAPAAPAPAARELSPDDLIMPQPSSAAASRPTAAGGVQVRQQILQYHKIDAGKKSGLLKGDISQHHPATRAVVILVILALATGLFFLTKWLTESTMPADWEKEGEAIERGIDD
jgi:predicted component of type VI protein secretion system